MHDITGLQNSNKCVTVARQVEASLGRTGNAEPDRDLADFP